MTELTRGPQQIEGFEVSHDGAWLVYNSDKSGNQDIYLAALDGNGDERAVTTDAATDSMPSLSPDHREVAFQSARENGIRDLYVYSLETDSLSLALKLQNQDYCPQWGPDGDSLYFFSYDTESWHVWKITRTAREADWSDPVQISHGNGAFARVSPRAGGPVVYFGTEEGIGTGLIGVWDNHKKRLLFPTEPNPWAYAAFAPDGASV
jgi:TolB protein